MPRHPGNSDGVNLTTSLCLTYIICISCVRLWIRKGSYGSDDLVIAVATIISFAHTATDFLALAYGLGRPWEQISGREGLEVLNAVSTTSVTNEKLLADLFSGLDRRRSLIHYHAIPVQMRDLDFPQPHHQGQTAGYAVSYHQRRNCDHRDRCTTPDHGGLPCGKILLGLS